MGTIMPSRRMMIWPSIIKTEHCPHCRQTPPPLDHHKGNPQTTIRGPECLHSHGRCCLAVSPDLFYCLVLNKILLFLSLIWVFISIPWVRGGGPENTWPHQSWPLSPLSTFPWGKNEPRIALRLLEQTLPDCPGMQGGGHQRGTCLNSLTIDQMKAPNLCPCSLRPRTHSR